MKGSNYLKTRAISSRQFLPLISETKQNEFYNFSIHPMALAN